MADVCAASTVLNTGFPTALDAIGIIPELNEVSGTVKTGIVATQLSSPDPSALDYADPTNPQSFNLYSYAWNNPLKFVDPTGLTACDFGNGTNNGQNIESVGNEYDCIDEGGTVIQYVQSVSVTTNQNGDLLEIPGSYSAQMQSVGAGPTPSIHATNSGSRTNQVLQCASKTANQLSMAGLLKLTGEGGGVGSMIGTAFLGNTFSGIVDSGTAVYNNFKYGGNGSEVMNNLILGGARQGLPGGGPLSAGVVGLVTATTVDAAAEGMSGPVGWAKLGIDGAIFAGSVAYCTNHQ